MVLYFTLITSNSQAVSKCIPPKISHSNGTSISYGTFGHVSATEVAGQNCFLNHKPHTVWFRQCKYDVVHCSHAAASNQYEPNHHRRKGGTNDKIQNFGKGNTNNSTINDQVRKSRKHGLTDRSMSSPNKQNVRVVRTDSSHKPHWSMPSVRVCRRMTSPLQLRQRKRKSSMLSVVSHQ
jgi:hypothetical protein